MIYCVEDDESILQLMLYTLRASHMECAGFSEGTALFAALEQRKPRVILLDIMLPGMDGIEILRRLRAAPETRELPVILASARGTEYDKVLGLDLGADDYLAKPFGMMEMVSRIRAVLRRCDRGSAAAGLQLGELTLDAASHRVYAAQMQVELTLKEFTLLKLLMENAGQVLTRDQLLQRVWSTDFAGESRTVDVHIATLRTKLGSCGSYIRTVRGVGYRMEVQP